MRLIDADALKTELEKLRDGWNYYNGEYESAMYQAYDISVDTVDEQPTIEAQPTDEDCRNCKKWNKCPCGKEGHENGTSIGYSIGECRDYEPNRCDSCEHSEEQDGSNCYECVKGMADNFEAQPTDKCKGCYYNDGEAHAECVVRDKGAQPCEDCISRQAVLDVINFEDEWLFDAKSHNADTKIAFSAIKYKISELPSVTPQRQKGKWIRVIDKAGHWVWECDCKWQQRFATNYCPNCGADMSGGGEE